MTRRTTSGETGLFALLGLASLLSVACAPYDLEGPAAPSVSISEHLAHGGVVLLASARLAEPAEVIGILDIQLPHGEHELGLEQLALQAAELGADAVVGVELTHGDGKRPMHLSGLAVRVLR
ncbi:MAG TPA: hypothetical protein ENK57_20900 [Polyangiaceae bacterium]|nr:hypothetical protein [Polyangiaceae bacterium]